MDALSYSLNKLKNTKRPLIFEGKIHSQTTLDWDDFVYRYKEDTDTFSIFFVKTTSEMVSKKVLIAKNVFAAKDVQDKILYLEFQKSHETLGFHLLDYPGDLNELPSMTLQSFYFPEENVLDIYFIDRNGMKIAFTDHFNYEIMFDLDKSGRYVSVEILNASKLLCKRKK